MPKSHTNKVNTAVTIPRELYEHIVAFISADTHHGYVSASEFIKDAARRRLDELGFQGRARDLGRKLDDLKFDTDRAAAKVRLGSPIAGRGFCRKCGTALQGDYCSNCGTKAG